MLDNIKKVVLAILKWGTSPIWFPWKVLFVRKPGKKFNEVDTKIKTFRVVRSPITMPLKFLLYVFIILVEVLIVYNVKTLLSTPFVRDNVQKYYISNNTKDLDKSQKEKLEAKYEEMFSKIDKMPSKAKKNFYAVMDSSVVKTVFKNADAEVQEHLLDRFNNEEDVRKSIEYSAQNMNTLIPKYISGSIDEDDTPAGLAVALTSKTIDTNLILDIAGSFMNNKSLCPDCQNLGDELTTKEIDEGIEALEFVYKQR